MAVPQTSMEGAVQQQEVPDQILVNYNTLICPDLYVCSECGATKLRLWRDFGLVVMASKKTNGGAGDQEERAYQARLTCWSCTLRLTGEEPSEELDGNVIRFPAVPTQVEERNGTLIFGYASSVTNEGMRWWRQLPKKRAAPT